MVQEGVTMSDGISGKENFRLGGVNGRLETTAGLEKVRPRGVYPRVGRIPQGQSQLHSEKAGGGLPGPVFSKTGGVINQSRVLQDISPLQLDNGASGGAAAKKGGIPQSQLCPEKTVGLPSPDSSKKGNTINQPRVLQDISPLQLGNGVSGDPAAKKGNIDHILQWSPSKGKRKEGEGTPLVAVRGKKTPNVRNGREEQGRGVMAPRSRDPSDFISTAKRTPSSSMRPRLLGIGGGAMRVRGGTVLDTATLFSLDSEDDTEKMQRAEVISMKSTQGAESRGPPLPSPSDEGLSRKLGSPLSVIREAAPITAQQAQQGLPVGNDVSREQLEMNRGGVPIVHEVEDSACKLTSSESEYGTASSRSSQSLLGEKVEVDAFQQTPPELEYSDKAHRLSQSSGEKVEGNNMYKKQSLLPGLACSAAANRLSQSSAGTTPSSDTLSGLPDEFNRVFNASNVILVNGNPYIKMACIGRGGSSRVHRVLSPEGHTFALKRVEIEAEDTSALSNYANEIELLKRLRGNSSIISLLDSEVDSQAGVVHLLMELGEIDLNQLLQSYKSQQQTSARYSPSRIHTAAGLEVNFVRLVWQQMLEAVDAMHEQRVVHSDLKPANFVFCRGTLKLIDFGIAKIISNNTTNISRDSQINPKTGQRGALMKLGRASDIWSLGCILYQLFLGHTPFSHLRWVQKLQAIVDHKYQVSYEGICDPSVRDVIKMCLQRNPAKRPTISGERGLLLHPFLNPCSTSKAPAVPVSVVRCIAKECIGVIQCSTGQADVDDVVTAVVRRLGGK